MPIRLQLRSLSGRLLAGALLMVACLITISIYTSGQVGQMSEFAQQTEAVRISQLQHMASVELHVTRLSLQLRHAMLARNDAERSETFAEIERYKGVIGQAIQAYEKAAVGQYCLRGCCTPSAA